MSPLVAIVLGAALLIPRTTAAQADNYATASVSTTQTYDDNLFAAATSRERQSDLITRFGPAFEVGHRAMPFKLVARYAIDAERYLNHVELNRDIARQDGMVDLGYESMERLSVHLNAAYLASRAPSEFNLESQLAAGRARAERLAMTSTAKYGVTQSDSVTADYGFAKDALVGAAASATHNARAGFNHRTGERNTYRIRYEFRRVRFANERDAGPSHAITTGWTHGMTERSNVEIDIGPRLSQRTIRMELSAAVRHRMRRGEVSVGGLRTEATAIGERGMIDVRRIGVGATLRPTNHLTMTVAPALASSSRDGLHARVYSIDVEAIAQASRRLSIAMSARSGRQTGTLAGLRETIPYRSVAVTLLVAAWQ